MALKAAADVNQVAADVKQAAENVNLGVKGITDVKKSKLWNQLWQGMWIDLIFEPLKWYSCSQIFSEQSYLKVDYPSLGRNRFIGYYHPTNQVVGIFVLLYACSVHALNQIGVYI